jgi:Xaa-Pro aminopeptidase
VADRLEGQSVDYPAWRRTQLASSLAQEGLDALLLTNPLSVTYLTGFSGESSYLLLGRERTLLVSDARFSGQLAEECPGLEVHIRPPIQNVCQATAEIVTKLGYRAVGFESGHLSVAEWEMFRELAPAVNWQGASNRVENLRAVKDASEVAQIREAIRIAERAFDAFRALIRPGDSEKTLCDALDHYVRRCGGRGCSFPSIVAVGERAALPHAPPTSRTAAEADLLLVDWGASGAFYKSDLTRVLRTRKNSAFAQHARAEADGATLDAVHAVVCKAQEEALRRIRPGVTGHEIDAAARAVITGAGYGDFFGHGLGHGLGLEIHEAPSLRPNAKNVLQAGMVTTVEPGIYLPEWGGVRIEDDVLVTPDGCEVLSRVPKDLRLLTLDF